MCAPWTPSPLYYVRCAYRFTHISDYLYAHGKKKREPGWWCGVLGRMTMPSMCSARCFWLYACASFLFSLPLSFSFSHFACPHAGMARTSTKAEHIKSCTLGNLLFFTGPRCRLSFLSARLAKLMTFYRLQQVTMMFSHAKMKMSSNGARWNRIEHCGW